MPTNPLLRRSFCQRANTVQNARIELMVPSYRDAMDRSVLPWIRMHSPSSPSYFFGASVRTHLWKTAEFCHEPKMCWGCAGISHKIARQARCSMVGRVCGCSMCPYVCVCWTTVDVVVIRLVVIRSARPDQTKSPEISVSLSPSLSLSPYVCVCVWGVEMDAQARGMHKASDDGRVQSQKKEGNKQTAIQHQER